MNKDAGCRPGTLPVEQSIACRGDRSAAMCFSTSACCKPSAAEALRWTGSAFCRAMLGLNSSPAIACRLTAALCARTGRYVPRAVLMDLVGGPGRLLPVVTVTSFLKGRR